MVGRSDRDQDSFDDQKSEMVDLLRRRNIQNVSVLQAFQKVPRHLFVPKSTVSQAYEDTALRIDCNQTISQPYIVAFMTEAAKVNEHSKVLEIGTGSGYQAAILAEIVEDVYTIEIVKPLADQAGALLKKLGYQNIHIKAVDDLKAWEKKAPFDAILVTAAAKQLPQDLLKQLKVGAHLIIPLEDESGNQTLMKITKTTPAGRCKMERLMEVRFVPMQ